MTNIQPIGHDMLPSAVARVGEPTLAPPSVDPMAAQMFKDLMAKSDDGEDDEEKQ